MAVVGLDEGPRPPLRTTTTSAESDFWKGIHVDLKRIAFGSRPGESHLFLSRSFILSGYKGFIAVFRRARGKPR